MPDVAQLGIAITADDRASRVLDDVQGRVRLTQTAFEGMSVSTVSKSGLVVGAFLAVGTAAAKMAEQGVRAASDLQHSVASISTIKPDVDTSAVFKSLNNLQTQVPQTAKQLGDSLYDVFSSIDNVTEAQGLKLVETFAKGATAAQTDAKTFGTAISGVLNAYKLDVSEAGKVSDVFFNTVNRGVVTGQQLASSLGPAVAAAKSLGVSYEEAFALIVGATKEGGDAAQNINNITNLLSKLPTKEATTDLNALGIATQTAAGALRSPIEVLTDLKAKLDTMSEAARATTLLTIFPDLQARQGAQVVMSQLGAVNTALAENRTATNSTAEAYAKMSATAVEQGKLLANTWSALLTDLGAVTLPALVGALGLVGAGVRTLREDFETAGTAIGEASTTIQTKTEAIKSDLDTLTTYADTNLRPQWDAFWKAATGGNYQMGPLPTPPPAPTPQQQEAAAGLGPTVPQYVPGVTPAPLEQTRSPFGGAGAGHLSPEESGLGPLGNIRGQFEDMFADMAESNARHAAEMADSVAENFSAQLLRRKPMMHDAGVELGDAAGEGVAEGLEAAEPAARSAALVARDLEEARKRQQVADLGGAVAIREHTEALRQDEIAQLGGAVAVRDHADALQRQQVAALGGATAIRDHDEALAREREQALGGALAIRDHAESLAREHEAALGGALAIRDHDEALAREQDAALGGAVAIRDHDEALQRQRQAALGGALAIRDHEEALARDKEANLGGALAIRDHAEALQREHEAALGGVAAIRDHEDALNRERTAALGGEVGIRAHAEALNEEKIAALGGRAAILDHQAALQKLDNQAKMAQITFATLADKMAVWAKMGTGGTLANPFPETLVNQALNYKTALSAIDQVTAQLANNSQKAEIDALKNANDLWGALTQSVEMAGLGYQDIAGLINGERDATERLNESIQANIAYRQQQQTAIQQANEAQFRAAITATGGGGAGGGTGSGATVLNTSGGGEASPFSNANFAAFYRQQYAEVEAAITAGAHIVLDMEALLADFDRHEMVRHQDRARADEAFNQTVAKMVAGVDRAAEKLAARLQTPAQQQAAFEGVPSYQSTYDTLAQQQATTQLSALTSGMSLAARAQVEFTSATQGPIAALAALGVAVDTAAQATTANTAATGVGSRAIQGYTQANWDGVQAYQESNAKVITAGLHAQALSGGMDFVGAAAARVQYNLLAVGVSAENAAEMALQAAEGFKLAYAVGKALMEGTIRNAGVLGGVTEKGLTYTQIMGGGPSSGSGGNAGGSSQGIVNVNPGNYFGIPIVSPLTGGTLRGFADGGWVTEPVVGRGLRSGAGYAFGERGPEFVSPGGGATTVQVVVHVNGADALRDPRLYEQMLDRGLTQAMQKRKLVAR